MTISNWLRDCTFQNLLAQWTLILTSFKSVRLVVRSPCTFFSLSMILIEPSVGTIEVSFGSASTGWVNSTFTFLWLICWVIDKLFRLVALSMKSAKSWQALSVSKLHPLRLIESYSIVWQFLVVQKNSRIYSVSDEFSQASLRFRSTSAC